jgi:RNA polymerase sigma-70 factor (ECF subfamily)
VDDETSHIDELDRADMLRLAAGHDAALNDLMERHGPRMFKYLFLSLQNQDDADDLTQETFVRVYQHRSTFDPNFKFSTWLYAIAANLVRTQFRYRTRHPQVSLEAQEGATGTNLRQNLPEETPNPSESMQTAESADAVRKALTTLPEDLRTPLILSEYEDLSHSEIGAILHCSPKAVEVRLYRARKHLRSILSRFIS